MEIQVLLNTDDINQMWRYLADIGFGFEEAVTQSGTQRIPTKTYVDSSGNFVCRVTVYAHETMDAGYMFHVFTSSHSVDTVTGAVVADGNTHQINFLNVANMRTYIRFTDAIMKKAGITGLNPASK